MCGVLNHRDSVEVTSEKRSELAKLLAAARGDAPGDLVLRHARLVNVASGEIYETDICIAEGRIAGLGDGYRGREEVDLKGAFVCPGLIDAHVHIESAMVPPREFARAVLPHGVTCVVADPHEIANVQGLDGVRFMLEEAASCPLAIYLNAPSCVPASALETSGATLSARDLKGLLNEPGVLGLGEVMDYPGVVRGEKSLLEKIESFRGRPIDGHCPGLGGHDLNAYLAAGIGSDHECSTQDEAREKMRLGMTVFIREGSSARNLDALLPLVTAANERRFCFCTDDRQPADLISEGSIDHLVRAAIASGVDPLTAIRMGTLNTVTHFGLNDRGLLTPGRVADAVVMDDLREFRPRRVYVGGQLMAEEGRMIDERGSEAPVVLGKLRVKWSKVDLAIAARGRRVRVIGIIPGQLITEHRVMECRVEQGRAVADANRDLLKIAVIERHHETGNVGLGFVTGMGLRRGAIAGTVAHDHHNLVVIGADDDSMWTALRGVAESGGGLAVAEGDRLISRLPLPIAGLMSDMPIEQVSDVLQEMIKSAQDLGSPLHDPFMVMSFLGLEVIPALKITDRGLVDVERMELTPLFTKE